MPATPPLWPYANSSDFAALGLPAKALVNVPPATLTECIEAAAAFCDSYLATRLTLPLLVGNWALTRSVAAIAAEDVLIVRGFNPQLGADIRISERAEMARQYMRDFGKGLQNMVVVDSGQPTNSQPAPNVTSEPLQGWGASWFTNNGNGPRGPGWC